MSTRYLWASEPRSMMGVGPLTPGEPLPAGVSDETAAAWLALGLVTISRPKRIRKKPLKTSQKPDPSGVQE